MATAAWLRCSRGGIHVPRRRDDAEVDRRIATSALLQELATNVRNVREAFPLPAGSAISRRRGLEPGAAPGHHLAIVWDHPGAPLGRPFQVAGPG